MAPGDPELLHSRSERELCRLDRGKDVGLVVLVGAHLATQNSARLVADGSGDVEADGLLLDLGGGQLDRGGLGTGFRQAHPDPIL